MASFSKFLRCCAKHPFGLQVFLTLLLIILGGEELAILEVEELSGVGMLKLRSMSSIAKSQSSRGKSERADVKEELEFGVFGGVCERE